MKLLFTLLFFVSFSTYTISQEFLWAQSYEISNCNEVAALAVDNNGFVYIAGVHDAAAFLPYTGNCYLQKTDGAGEFIWTEYMTGTLQIGDMAAVGSSVIIIGQSNGPFTYKGVVYSSAAPYFMFVIKIDGNGDPEWYFMDDTKYGANTNISVSKLGKVALQIRGQGNLGDWIYIVDSDGNILNTKMISAASTTITDIAYYDDKVYLNGGFNGPGSLIIDTIVIQQTNIENAAFILAFDVDLIAEWVSIDTTFLNRDGRVEANAFGVFTYQEVIEPPFTIIPKLKKFSFGGQILAEIAAPVYTTSVTLYPDMAISPTTLGLFVENDFNFDSHKVMLFDFNLEMISEKVINGSSDLYSGQIASKGEDFYVAHVYSGGLNLNNELTLPYEGTGKLPYIAKMGTPLISEVPNGLFSNEELLVYPNPAKNKITISLSQSFQDAQIRIIELNGNEVKRELVSSMMTAVNVGQLNAGVYVVEIISPEGKTQRKKIFIL